MDTTQTAATKGLSNRAPARINVGTCPVCGHSVAIVNYAIERGREVGYLGRHSRPGIPATSKCRGSFGYWVEKPNG